MILGVVAVVALFGGIIAGSIAYSKAPTTGTFVGYFILGACFPLIGIVIAALSKGPQQAPPPVALQPAGWYPDPHRQAAVRWWDGSQWTGHIDSPNSI